MTAGICLFYSGLSLPSAEAQVSDISEERSEEASRIRVSLTGYQFTIDEKLFTGSGTEFGFERSLSPHWNASGALGQAYTIGTKNFGTLFTLIDISIWYSIWGAFTQERRVWRDAGNVVATYEDKRSRGLRIGLGTQQYFFNTPNSAIPFSGLAMKVLYELGLNFSFDLAIGAEAARLLNANYTATTLRGFGSIIWPLKP